MRPPKPRTPAPKEFQELERRDEHILACLIDKYGLDNILHAAPTATKTIGRPSRGDMPAYEKIYDADWIEDRIEEYREAGHPSPTTQARTDFYHMKYGNWDIEPSESQLATIKKRHLEGRSLLKQIREKKTPR